MALAFGMGEDLTWAGESACGQGRGLLGSLGLFQGLEQDAFHATHVDQVHLQGSAAGGIEAFGRVALAQADELVALPDSGPGQGPVKEAFGELAHRGALLGGAALDAVGRPQRVGAQLGGIVSGVSGAAALGLAGVDLDQLAPVVDSYQLEAQTDLNLLPGRAQGGRHGVKGVLAGHVVVGVNFRVAPVGDLVGLVVPGSQRLALLVQEDLQGLTAGGAVDSLSGDVTAPAGRFITEVVQVSEIAALEEALPGVLDAPLHYGLVLRVTYPGRICDEAPVLGVFQEAAGQAGIQGIGAR